MRRTNLRLYYLAGYLLPAGLLLLTVPEFARKLLLSNRDYDDAPFRLVGVLAIVLIGVALTTWSYLTDRRRLAGQLTAGSLHEG